MASTSREFSRSSQEPCPVQKRTVYLANFAFSLTNSDVMQMVENCGKIAQCKIVKDRNRVSKGYAFVQFAEESGALKCIEEFDGTLSFGRKLKCSIAKDNGRSGEFATKRKYARDRCYECGSEDHCSYSCPKNVLGERVPPVKCKRKKKNTAVMKCKRLDEEQPDSADSNEESDEWESLGDAIKKERAKEEEHEYRVIVEQGNYGQPIPPVRKTVRKYEPDSYFSDEESVVDKEITAPE